MLQQALASTQKQKTQSHNLKNPNAISYYFQEQNTFPSQHIHAIKYYFHCHRIPLRPTPTFSDWNSELSHWGGPRGALAPAPPNNGYTDNEVNPCTSATPSVTHWIRNGFAPAIAPPERQLALGHTSPISPSADSGDAGGSQEKSRQGLQA